MSIFDEYYKDIQRYLTSKFPDEDMHKFMEMAEYITNRTTRLIESALIQRDREWKRSLRRGRSGNDER